jgi:tryptophanyl-tRNA synthetase
MNMEKKRLISGDRPTGRLHLGHYVGSIQTRLKFQTEYECFFFIADLHMLTTKKEKEYILASRDHIHDMVVDYLACGIDPKTSTLYLQSAIEAIYELNLIVEMLVNINRLHDLPSIKEMAKNAHMEMEAIPFGLLGYPVLMSADILLAKAHVVPVGKDNEPHVELARDVARRFNSLYGEVFPLPELLLSEMPTLLGTDGLGKMSKSAGNAIFLSDSPEEVAKKIRGAYTDPQRIHANIPGKTEGNPVFSYLDAFDLDKAEVQALKERYRSGTVSDVEVKERATAALNSFLDPIRDRRNEIVKEKGLVEEIIYDGTMKMQDITRDFMKEIKSAMGLSGTWNKISRLARERKAQNARF